MSYLVLARKYRPQTFDEVVAQPHITDTLKNAITQNRVAHALCLAGPRGTGKTTVARILAKAMNCEKGPTPAPCGQCVSCTEITSGSSVDVFEIDGASNNGVEQIRSLRENVQYVPAHGKYKIYIVDEVHMLTTAAFNALLKTLEEPPSHVMFILATTESHKIPVTILSRCQRFDFRRISLDDIVAHMTGICGKEKFSIDEESLWAVAKQSGGCMRDALSLLDQIMAYTTSGSAAFDQVLEILGVADRKTLFALAQALLKHDATGCLLAIDGLYQKGHDLKKLMSDLVEYIRNLIVVKMVKDPAPLLDVSQNEIKAMSEQVKGFSLSFLNQVVSLLLKEEAQLRFSTQPRLALEVGLLRICEITPAVAIDNIIERLDELASRPAVLAAPSPQPDSHRALPERPAIDVSAPVSGIPAADDAPVPADMAPHPSAPPDSDDPWDRLLHAVSAKFMTLGSHLKKCRLKKFEENALVIETDGHPFCRDALNKKENLAKIQSLCDELFDPPVTVSVAEPGGENQEKTTPDKAQTRRQTEKQALDHPLVHEAVDIFGGRVVEVRKL